MEKAFGVRIHLTPEGFITEGDSGAAEAALRFIGELSECVEEGHRFGHAEITVLARTIAAETSLTLRDLVSARVAVSAKRRHVVPKSPVQREYIEAIQECNVVFGVGPAGTGKNLSGHGDGRLRAFCRRRTRASF